MEKDVWVTGGWQDSLNSSSSIIFCHLASEMASPGVLLQKPREKFCREVVRVERVWKELLSQRDGYGYLSKEWF